MSLYKTLGVRKNATPEQIRKAFRKQSMKWHPDRNPGNPEAKARFQAVAEAYDCLSDPARRQHYDATGEVRGGPDNSLAGAMTIISQAFDSVATKMIEEGVDPKTHDMLASIRATIEHGIRPVKETAAKLRRQIAKAKKFGEAIRDRFETAEPENIFVSLVDAQLSFLERAAKQLGEAEAEIGRADAALELLKKYRFRFDQATATVVMLRRVLSASTA